MMHAGVGSTRPDLTDLATPHHTTPHRQTRNCGRIPGVDCSAAHESIAAGSAVCLDPWFARRSRTLRKSNGGGGRSYHDAICAPPMPSPCPQAPLLWLPVTKPAPPQSHSSHSSHSFDPSHSLPASPHSRPSRLHLAPTPIHPHPVSGTGSFAGRAERAEQSK
jgi:hypothetical protein